MLVFSLLLFLKLPKTSLWSEKSKFMTLKMIFLSFLILNFSSLFPWIPALTKEIQISLLLAGALWLSFLFLSLKGGFKATAAHLVPHSSPGVLISPLILIETTSLLIRPLTLGVRLSANIFSGHLILSLASGTFPSLVGILLLETLVSLMQAYVFSSLLAIYD